VVVVLYLVPLHVQAQPLAVVGRQVEFARPRSGARSPAGNLPASGRRHCSASASAPRRWRQAAPACSGPQQAA
jgi:hypothetical protein